MAGHDAVANHQGEQVGPDDAENAADGSADQPLQADPAQPPLEKDDGEADQRAYTGVQLGGQAERISQITSNSNYENK